MVAGKNASAPIAMRFNFTGPKNSSELGHSRGQKYKMFWIVATIQKRKTLFGKL